MERSDKPDEGARRVARKPSERSERPAVQPRRGKRRPQGGPERMRGVGKAHTEGHEP